MSGREMRCGLCGATCVGFDALGEHFRADHPDVTHYLPYTEAPSWWQSRGNAAAQMTKELADQLRELYEACAKGARG